MRTSIVIYSLYISNNFYIKHIQNLITMLFLQQIVVKFYLVLLRNCRTVHVIRLSFILRCFHHIFFMYLHLYRVVPFSLSQLLIVCSDFYKKALECIFLLRIWSLFLFHNHISGKNSFSADVYILKSHFLKLYQLIQVWRI